MRSLKDRALNILLPWKDVRKVSLKPAAAQGTQKHGRHKPLIDFG
jgi:hypothetical protein